jgi:hypothetical protein
MTGQSRGFENPLPGLKSGAGTIDSQSGTKDLQVPGVMYGLQPVPFKNVQCLLEFLPTEDALLMFTSAFQRS